MLGDNFHAKANGRHLSGIHVRNVDLFCNCLVTFNPFISPVSIIYSRHNTFAMIFEHV